MMLAKHFGFRRGVNGHGLVVELGKYFGFYAERIEKWSIDSEPAYLCFTIWYRAGKNQLGYLYPSIRCF